MSTSMPLKYSPSNRTSPTTFALIAPTFLAAAALAAVYTLLSHWIPFIIADLALWVAFAFGLAFMLGAAMKHGKCRSPIVAALIGIAAGSVAMAASHYTAYLWTLRSLPAGGTLGFFDYLDVRAKVGWSFGKRSKSGMPITGWMVWTLWALEAAVVILAACVGASKAACQPFCETCHAWADKEAQKFGIPGLTPGSIERISESDGLDEILSPPLEEIGPGPTVLNYRVRSCPKCERVAFLDLEKQTTTYDKKGQATVANASVGSCLALSPEEVQAIDQLKADIQTAIEVRTRALSAK